MTGGGVAGAVAGTVVATPLIPTYIPDNQAFFILGTTWIGAAEGMGARVRLAAGDDEQIHDDGDNCPPGSEPCRPPIGNQLRAAFVGSLPGLAIGLTAGSLMAKKAPTYGRVTLIQSAALGGMVAGALTQVTVKWKPYGATWEQSYRQADEHERCR